MSFKSILLSILTLVFMVGGLFGIVFLFGINVALGIVGIVAWLFIPTMMRGKALDAANGPIDRVIAKYILPVVAAVLTIGTIIYLILHFLSQL